MDASRFCEINLPVSPESPVVDSHLNRIDPGSGAMFTNGFNKPKAMTVRIRLLARGLRDGGKETQGI